MPPKLLSLLLARDSPLKLHLHSIRAVVVGLGVPAPREHRVGARDDRGTAALAELSREFIEPLIEGEGIDCHFTRGGKLVVYPDRLSFATARAQVEFQATLGSEQRALNTEECINASRRSRPM